MNTIATRLQSLLDQKGLTPYKLSKRAGISQSTLSRILNQDSKPNESNLKAIVDFFGVSEQWLLTGSDVTILSEPKQEYIVNKNGNKFVELKDGTYDIEVPLIPFSAHASYVESLETGHVEEDFQTMTFNVDRIGRGNYKAFIVKGDSMNGGKINDTPDGAKVLGRELGRHHWKDGFSDTQYGWIILCKKNIFHKDITNYDNETGMITCHSRNSSPEYSDFNISLNDCYQIFKVIKRIF